MIKEQTSVCRYLIQNVPVAHKAAGARIADRMIKWHEFVFPMLANFYFKVHYYFFLRLTKVACNAQNSKV